MEPELLRLRDPSELLSNVRTFRTSEAISIYAPATTRLRAAWGTFAAYFRKGTLT